MEEISNTTTTKSRKVENIFPLLLHICTFKQNLQQGAEQVKQ
jgi:hypothetical protein